MEDLRAYLKARQKEVDRTLDRFLPKASTKPATIHQAMRYSLFAGGKRLRPILCLAAAEACGGLTNSALPLACALECIHTYSLIHDDLPSMDNDDFRRGRATCHKVYGDGIAILAGDALLTIAFEIAAAAEGWSRYDLREIFREISIAAGSRKLIAGQVADLEGEGKKLNLTQLRYIHENKTAALLTTSVRLGAMSANATPTQLRAISEFGYALGLAFQVIDDILDVTQTSEKLGKSAGKDAAAQKATYPAVLGLEKSRREAGRLTRRAHDALRPLGRKADRLHEIANYLLEREY
jgi:geranylgeranyl diphosphate synthase type II